MIKKVAMAICRDDMLVLNPDATEDDIETNWYTNGDGYMRNARAALEAIQGRGSMIDDLIERIGNAKHGCRELDAEIWVHVGLTHEDEEHCRLWCSMDGRTDLTRPRFIDAHAPHYTTSLDAKIPRENIVEVKFHESPDGDAYWTALHVAPGQSFAGTHIEVFEGRGNTEAIARRSAPPSRRVRRLDDTL